MRLVNGIWDDGPELGVELTEGVTRARDLDPSGRRWTMEDVLADSASVLRKLQGWVDAKVGGFRIRAPETWLAPILKPEKVLCVGLNYRPHVAESHFDIPEYPVLFNKFANAIVGPGATVTAPPDGKELDYEAELVMVVGKTCRNVSEAEALDYVLGYTCGNDLSIRDLQFRTMQWLLGKALDGLGPIGPTLVTRDSIADPNHLRIQLLRNGEIVQDSNTREMIFPCAYLVHYISQYMTLVPGDLIFTGTPENTIHGQDPATRQWLQSGERVTVAIEELGELTTVIG